MAFGVAAAAAAAAAEITYSLLGSMLRPQVRLAWS
jgi:hypothetical protein